MSERSVFSAGSIDGKTTASAMDSFRQWNARNCPLIFRKEEVLYKRYIEEAFFKKKRVNAEPIISGSFHIKNQRKKNKRRNLENKAFLLSEVLDKEKALGVIGIP